MSKYSNQLCTVPVFYTWGKHWGFTVEYSKFIIFSQSKLVLSWLRSCFAVHNSCNKYELMRIRHESFINANINAGLLAILALAGYLYVADNINYIAVAAILWLHLPLINAFVLAQTGNLILAHFLSTINLAITTAISTLFTGGIHSFLICWIFVLPIEAALSSSKKVVTSSVIIGFLIIIGLIIIEINGLLPKSKVSEYDQEILWLIGIISSLGYAGALLTRVGQFFSMSDDFLHVNAANYYLMAENASDIITIHKGNGETIFASGAINEIIGCQAENILKDGLINKIYIEDKEKFITTFKDAKEQGKIISNEFRFNDNNGNLRWAEIRCRPLQTIRDENYLYNKKNIKNHSLCNITSIKNCVVAVIRDISEMKKIQKKLYQAKENAEQANKAKTTFMANVSHELRTPLNSIIGFSQLLERKYAKVGTNGSSHEYIKLIYQSGSHLLEVVNGLLDIAKMEAGEKTINPETFSINYLVTQCIAIAKGNSEIDIDIDIPEELKIHGDFQAFKQIIINLVANAIKFSGENGQIKIKSYKNNSGVNITISDNGIGIAEDILPKLCKPFVQANTAYNKKNEGTGLGLSIAAGLIKLHGGTINIKSKIDKGTTIIITVPDKISTEKIKNDTYRHIA